MVIVLIIKKTIMVIIIILTMIPTLIAILLNYFLSALSIKGIITIEHSVHFANRQIVFSLLSKPKNFKQKYKQTIPHKTTNLRMTQERN